MVVVREFVRADQVRVRRLILDGLAERWAAEFDESYNPDLDDIKASYVDQGATVLVIESDGELVATGTLLPRENQTGQLVRISVDPTIRRHGLGRRIVGELVERARRSGMTEVRVLADTPWVSAVELYRSCGFEITAQDDDDTCFRMSLHR